MGYRQGDLQDLVKPIFEIDAYKSKMGDDESIVVVSFTVKENNAAKDLVDFIEKGYGFVLDADSTPGEIDDGIYKVFVEMERNKNVNTNILELIDGVSKISNIDSFKFRYYKNFKSYPASIDSLNEIVPLDRMSYLTKVNETRMDNYKDFFSKSYLESIELIDDDLYIKKAYADPVLLKVKDFGSSHVINESIKEKINMNDYAEILFFTKYIGDYNITKFGKNIITLENEGHTLVLERA